MFAKTLKEVADEVEDIYLVAADISPVSVPDFQNAYPEKFINVGVSEQCMIGLCAGLALRGARPFAYTIANFSAFRPFEQIRVDLCYQNLPVTIVGMGSGVTYSKLGGTHHTIEDIAVLGAIPNMTILAPCDPAETAASVWECSKASGPVYLRFGKAGEPDLTSDAPDKFEFGKIRCIRKGTDGAILTYGPITKSAFEIADRLKKEKSQDIAIFSCHTLKPLDEAGIGSVLNQFPKVLVIEEHTERGGLASQVEQIAWRSGATAKLKCFSLKDEFIHFYGSHEELLSLHGLNPSRIYEQYLSL